MMRDSFAASLFIVIIFSSANGGYPDARRLHDDLLANYNKLVRPVINSTDVLSVEMKLKLSQLIDVVRSLLMNLQHENNVRCFSQLCCC